MCLIALDPCVEEARPKEWQKVFEKANLIRQKNSEKKLHFRVYA